MKEILLRFAIGGIVVSFFAALGDTFKPKSFAGLFGAAPSVALATLALTAARHGRVYAAMEARSMIAGAIAFFIYASWVSWSSMRYRVKALPLASASIVIWAAASFGSWLVWLR